MKIGIRFSAFTAGLLLALSIHFAWRGKPELSLCDIDREPGRYAGKIVRLRAFASNDVSIGSPIATEPHVSALSVCHGKDDWPAANVDVVKEQLSLVRETKHVWRKELDNEKSYISEVVLVGRFEPPDGMLHCFGPKYQISNARIERVISTEELDRGQIVEWMKSKSR